MEMVDVGVEMVDVGVEMVPTKGERDTGSRMDRPLEWSLSGWEKVLLRSRKAAKC